METETSNERYFDNLSNDVSFLFLKWVSGFLRNYKMEKNCLINRIVIRKTEPWTIVNLSYIDLLTY